MTGVSRNAVYQARRSVFQRLRELGGSYDLDGQLSTRIKQAFHSQPGAIVDDVGRLHRHVGVERGEARRVGLVVALDGLDPVRKPRPSGA